MVNITIDVRKVLEVQSIAVGSVVAAFLVTGFAATLCSKSHHGVLRPCRALY